MSRLRSLSGKLTTVEDGRLVEYERDVLDIKAEIIAKWPELEVFFDRYTEEWVIAHTDRRGDKYVVFTTKALNRGTIERIDRADQNRKNHVDILDRIDSHNDSMERELEDRFAETINLAGERLHHALIKDGILDRVNFFT